MSLLISIILAVFSVIFSMLSVFYANYKVPKNRSKNSKLPVGLNDYKDIISLYCKLFSILIGVWFVIYIVKNNTSNLDSYLELLIFLILLYISKIYYPLIQQIGIILAPYLIKFAKFIAPFTYTLINLLKKLSFKNTGNIYTKESLINLINNINPDEEFSKNDLDLAVRGLNFSNLVVKDYYTPRKVVKFLDADAEISTVMIDDLYKSGFSRFPVYASYQDNIIGTLYLKDLVEKKYSGKVARIMSTDVYEIKENDTLTKALNLFIKTRHHLFIVKNEFSDILGVITVEDVLEQLIGREIMDESDKVADLRLEAVKVRSEDIEKL